jgi:hypothetical protein
VSFESRSLYELGDEALARIAAEERRDSVLAPARGQRVQVIADAVVAVLLKHGLLREPRTATVVLFHAIADCLYGNAALDIPQEPHE